jgi:hypothetical protein
VQTGSAEGYKVIDIAQVSMRPVAFAALELVKALSDAGSGAELAVDVVRVRLDRVLGDEQLAADLPDGEAGREQAEDLELALTQLERNLAGRGSLRAAFGGVELLGQPGCVGTAGADSARLV